MKNQLHFLIRNRRYIASSAFALIPFVPLVWVLLQLSFSVGIAIIALMGFVALVIASMVVIGDIMQAYAKKQMPDHGLFTVERVAVGFCLDAAEHDNIPSVVHFLNECKEPPINSIIHPGRHSGFVSAPVRFFDWVIYRCKYQPQPELAHDLIG